MPPRSRLGWGPFPSSRVFPIFEGRETTSVLDGIRRSLARESGLLAARSDSCRNAVLRPVLASAPRKGRGSRGRPWRFHLVGAHPSRAPLQDEVRVKALSRA